MDEQRVQAYVELIEQLLGCPQGEEGALLQANAELVDAGLLAVMGLYADQLENQGNGNAGWLRQFAAELAQALRLEENNLSNQSSDMDEQRIRAYMGLIEQLLGCPQGEEDALLQANAELVDVELLAVMDQVANYLEKQGDSKAIWLQNFGAQMAQVLVASENATPTNDFTKPIRFLGETLQLIVEQQYDPQKIYPLWAQQQGWFNEALLNVFSLVVEELQLLAREQNQQESLASALAQFGSLISKFPLGKRWLNIELAINAYKQALQVMTREIMPVDWAKIKGDLATAYKDRLQEDRAQNIEDAIAAYQEALEVITFETMPIEWATLKNNQGTAYRNRIRGDQAQNIEDAIVLFQQALQVRTRENQPVAWAQTMHNLANVYSDRIQGDRAQNIEDAIAAYDQTLEVRTREAIPVKWAQTEVSRARAYSERLLGDREQNIEEAIAAYGRALGVMTPDAMPFEWALTTMNLGTAYLDRIRDDKAQNIETAIEAYNRALQVITRGAMPIEWAALKDNLGTAYRNRIRDDKSQNIETAIEAYNQALQVITREAMPIRWAGLMENLGIAYADRLQGDLSQNIERAIEAYQASLTIFTPELMPEDYRRSARKLANLYSDQQRWQEAAPVYQKILQAAETLYQSSILLDSKAVQLFINHDLSRRAAYALARIGQLSQAVEVLEQGRARGLSESLGRDRADLSQLEQTHPTLYRQYQSLTVQLRNLESQQRDLATSDQRYTLSFTTLRDTATDLRNKLKQTLTQICQVEGYVDFLAQPSFEDIRTALRSECPLVYLVTTPNGSMALIVTVDETNILWLSACTETRLMELLVPTWLRAYDHSRINHQGWLEAIDTVTCQLWDILMGPLVNYLQAQNIGRITLISTGYLSLLPLHAAWTADPSCPTGRCYALDDIHFTYAPNAQSLMAARAISARVQADSILAIDNPRQDLSNSEQEVQAAISTFLPHVTIFRHHRATTTAIKIALPQAAIAHFSCHGTANLNEPLNSGLLMNDSLLTLKDIFELNLTEGDRGLRLAILSACETGIIGLENADEAISLPTGLLQAGVAAVIASLWSVDDRSTMLLLTKFYDLWRRDSLSPDQALRQAQIWLRDSTAGGIAAYGGFFTPDPSDRPYAHPFHWAAFSYTGI